LSSPAVGTCRSGVDRLESRHDIGQHVLKIRHRDRAQRAGNAPQQAVEEQSALLARRVGCRPVEELEENWLEVRLAQLEHQRDKQRLQQRLDAVRHVDCRVRCVLATILEAGEATLEHQHALLQRVRVRRSLHHVLAETQQRQQRCVVSRGHSAT
jgi:hypothetical protein